MQFQYNKCWLLILLFSFSVSVLYAKGEKKNSKGKHTYFEPPLIENDFRPKVSQLQLDFADALGIDSIPFTEYDNIALLRMLEEVLEKDSTMNRSFPQLKAFGVKEIRCDDNLRIFSWGKDLFVLQFKIAENRTRLVSVRSLNIDFNLRGINISSIYPMGKGVYVIGGEQFEGFHTFVGIDISTNVQRRAYIGSKADQEAEFRATQDQFDQLYYNGAYLAPKEEHIADSLFRGKILRSYHLDYTNRYRITRKAKADNFTYLAELHDGGLGTSDLLPETIVTFRDSINKHIFRVKNFDNKFCIENLNLDLVFKMDSIYNNSREGDYPRVRLACGKHKGLSYEWLIYTVCCLDGSPTQTDYAQIRWAVEVDDKLYDLDPKIHSGCQIRLQMKEEWVGKTIYVIPFLGEIDWNVSQATTVVSMAY